MTSNVGEVMAISAAPINELDRVQNSHDCGEYQDLADYALAADAAWTVDARMGVYA